MRTLTTKLRGCLRTMLACAALCSLSGAAAACNPRSGEGSRPAEVVPSPATGQPPASALSAEPAADVNRLVQSIVALPEVNKQALEGLLGVELAPESRKTSFEFYAARMPAGAFEQVEFSPPKAGGTDLMVILNVRSGVEIPQSAFEAMFEASQASFTVSPPHKRDADQTYAIRSPSGYTTHYVFDANSETLNKVVIRRS